MSGGRRQTTRRAIHRWWWVVVASSLLGALPVTRAEAATRASDPQAEARGAAKAAVDRAQLDYTLGRFQEALDGYSHAYELFEAPALLFNIGQCHRNLGNHERAIFFFEGYLRAETKPNREKRGLAADLFAESKAELARQRADDDARIARERAASARPPARTPSRTLALAPDPAAAPAVSLEANATPPPRASGGHGGWLWGAAVAVAIAVAAGAAAYYVTGDPKLVPPAGSVGTLDRH
jgi:tetratricopeptide (TPR) repeat protein